MRPEAKFAVAFVVANMGVHGAPVVLATHAFLGAVAPTLPIEMVAYRLACGGLRVLPLLQRAGPLPLGCLLGPILAAEPVSALLWQAVSETGPLFQNVVPPLLGFTVAERWLACAGPARVFAQDLVDEVRNQPVIINSVLAYHFLYCVVGRLRYGT
jgi:hypothetical protein